MIIKNNSESFNIRYNYKDYKIKKGEMEINNDAFAIFIIEKAAKYGKDVVKVAESKKEEIAEIETREVENDNKKVEKENKKKDSK